MTGQTRTSRAILQSVICLGFFLFIPPVHADEAPGKGHPGSLFALTNCARCEKYTMPDAHAGMLKELGYAGIAPAARSASPRCPRPSTSTAST